MSCSYNFTTDRDGNAKKVWIELSWNSNSTPAFFISEHHHSNTSLLGRHQIKKTNKKNQTNAYNSKGMAAAAWLRNDEQLKKHSHTQLWAQQAACWGMIEMSLITADWIWSSSDGMHKNRAVTGPDLVTVVCFSAGCCHEALKNAET